MKKILPILGVVLMSTISTNVNASENIINPSNLKMTYNNLEENNLDYIHSNPESQSFSDDDLSCTFLCSGSCSGSCGRACSWNCSSSCSGSCQGACKGGCGRSCSYGCSGSSKGF